MKSDNIVYMISFFNRQSFLLLPFSTISKFSQQSFLFLARVPCSSKCFLSPNTFGYRITCFLQTSSFKQTKAVAPCVYKCKLTFPQVLREHEIRRLNASELQKIQRSFSKNLLQPPVAHDLKPLSAQSKKQSTQFCYHNTTRVIPCCLLHIANPAS